MWESMSLTDLIFSKVASTFLGVCLSFLPFQVWSFTKSDCRDFIAGYEWPQFIRRQATALSGLGAMLESYHEVQPKP